MKIAGTKCLPLMLTLLLAPIALFSQNKDNDQAAPVAGVVEMGSRWSWGDVYGRPDLPFDPSLKTSKYNEYRDLRDGFFIPRVRLTMDDIAGSKYFLDVQSNNAIYRDQSYLATFGAWNRFRVQFRYDEIPHTYTNTARTPYTQTAPGVLTIPLLTRNSLQALAASPLLPSTIQTQLVPSMNFIVPAIERRAGTFMFAYDLTPDWDLLASYSREHETGTRPLGLIFNSSPSAALSGGYGAEVPEPIDYFNNLVRVRAEYVRKRWAIQIGYTGSFFQNNRNALFFDNPFRTTDCVAPVGCTAATQGPARGEVDLYPDNHAHYINVAGTLLLMKHLRLLFSINAGWLRQDDPFVPYTTNTLLLAGTGPLPASSLHGEKQTLAMNYKLIQSLGKKFEIKAGYRQYDYNNDTPVLSFTPVEGDSGAASLTSPEENTPFGYNRKNVEVTGNWYYAKKSSVKVGYEGEIMDRSNRDVEHSTENGFVAAIDSAPRKDLSFRVSYRYSARNPEQYQDDQAAETAGGITNDQIFSRRFDEATRTRNRGDAEIQYSPTDRLSFSGFAGTLQDNFNHQGGVNSPTPLNFIAGTSYPYYLYGVLKDLSYNAGFDSDFSLTNAITLFAEYSYERYYKAMASRYRVPGGATPLPLDCSAAGHGCDSANNDWGSTARDYVHIFAVGWDTHFSKKTDLDTYYTLSAAKGNVDSRPFGNPTLLTGPDKFLLTGTNAAVDYPETVSRNHQVVAVFRYKVTNNLTSKVEYRYQQFDSKDYQTSAMTPYMGCVSPLPPGAPVPGCTSPLLGTPSPFYPYFLVGDTSAARYLFLGADQPSYRAHYLAATVEYHF
ncbi:MAG TPA: MtrB/PioB family decaheme-associated outer membrane protein [Terriglobales bacterium]|jgi:MtrB/PioB family decaheme-associated outer membrane protein|nr:MtrB/PioB family decaheme-associated outer membrane protein [Terriglobales bacterium]